MMKMNVMIQAVIAFLLVSGCDNFSLLEQFSENSPPSEQPNENPPLELVLGKATIENGEEVSLIPSGGLEPYTYSVVEEDLYYSSSLGRFSDNTFTAGNSVGKVKIILKDAEEKSVSESITVIPPPPENLSLTNSGGNKVAISWTYSHAERISGFVLFRIDPGNIVKEVSTLSAANYSHQDRVDPSNTYSYYLKAKAGDFLSNPSEVREIVK